LDLSKIQEMLGKFEQERGWDRFPASQVFAHLVEELGEVARHITVEEGYKVVGLGHEAPKKEDLSREFAQVISLLFQLANPKEIPEHQDHAPRPTLSVAQQRGGCTHQDLPPVRPHQVRIEARMAPTQLESLVDQMSSTKSEIKRLLTITFPELEQIAGVFSKSMLRLLCQYPSAASIKQAKRSKIAKILIPGSYGKQTDASVQRIVKAAQTSIGTASPAKEIILKQKVSC
jgi:NTP pyrophosphatase (non-canonical NTP hydrolase)